MALGALLAAAIAGGCVHYPPAAEVEFQLLPHIQDGNTTREQALSWFGDPTEQFEGERILTFRLGLFRGELHPVRREPDPRDGIATGWRSAQYSLVLVFDEEHVLQRHSLVLVK